MQGQSTVQRRDDGLTIEKVPFRALAARVRERGCAFIREREGTPMSTQAIAWTEEENPTVEVVWMEEPFHGPHGTEWGFFRDGTMWTIAGGEDPRP